MSRMRVAPAFRTAAVSRGATQLNRPLCSVTKRQKSVTPRRMPRGHHGWSPISMKWMRFIPAPTGRRNTRRGRSSRRAAIAERPMPAAPRSDLGRDQSEEDEPPLPELGFVPPDPVLLENGLQCDGHPDKAHAQHDRDRQGDDSLDIGREDEPGPTPGSTHLIRLESL